MEYSLGVVTNCWMKLLDKGERFDDLVIRFCRQGFTEIEIRDGDYLRRSSFGGFLDRIEKIMANYDPGLWCGICDRIHRGDNWRGLASNGDRSLLEEIDEFIKHTAGAKYSYAIAFPWLSQPSELEADGDRITTALKLAYLLNPPRPRLRLVSLEPVENIDAVAAAANLKRYKRLTPGCPVTLVVENALHPAPLILKLARAGGVPLAYDEANNYRSDGTVLNTPDEFWRSVRIEDLASVHLKQKNDQGALAQLGDGFVDLHALMDRLVECGYKGDLLLENAAADHPLEDALASLAYVF